MTDNKSPHQLPTPGHAYIYAITHKETGRVYVGHTLQSLSERWRGHVQKAREYRRGRNAGKSLTPEFHIMLHDPGPMAFDVTELEECGVEIKLARELDYMRHLESWNPTKGYNSPGNELRYAKKACFLFHPAHRAAYIESLSDRANFEFGDHVAGDREAMLRREKAMHAEWVRIGRPLMALISSLASPVVTLD